LSTKLILPPPQTKAIRDPHNEVKKEVKIKQVVRSVHETTRLWRKLHPKVQLFQHKEGGMLYWPDCWVAYKRKSWRA
jgi:hypothetical protein